MNCPYCGAKETMPVTSISPSASWFCGICHKYFGSKKVKK